MPKTRRPYAPGSIFHVTARTQGKVTWFEEETMRDRIANIICDASIMSRTPVIAFVVMPNHLHLIVRQGQAPLAWLMHRVMHRTALLVKKKFKPDGHVFGAPYYSGMCEDASHARQVILYTHLNPFRAELCAHPRDYRWSSYHNYAAVASSPQWNLRVDDGLNLFASYSDDIQHMRESHDVHVAYWMARKTITRWERYIFTEEERSIAPAAAQGDVFWKHHCCENGDVMKSRSARAFMPIADRAIALLKQLDPDLSLDYVRMVGRGRLISKLRRELIAGLLSYDYAGTAIGRCLNVSSGLVSAVRLELETGDIERILKWSGREI